MNMRRVIVIFAAFALLVCASAIWDAQGDERDGDTATNVVASSGAEAGTAAAAAQRGGGDDGKVARATEEGPERLERAGVERLEDRATPPRAAAGGGSARDCLERG